MKLGLIHIEQSENGKDKRHPLSFSFDPSESEEQVNIGIQHYLFL
jgi:hypothetical protein